jgi:hypothetical protein
VSPLYATEALEGDRRYSSHSFLTSTLDGGKRSVSRPGRALSPGKGPPVPIIQKARLASEPVWTQRLEEKSFACAGDRTSIARSPSPVARHYTELPGSSVTTHPLIFLVSIFPSHFLDTVLCVCVHIYVNGCDCVS